MDLFDVGNSTHQRPGHSGHCEYSHTDIMLSSEPEEEAQDGGLAAATGAHQGAACASWHMK